MNLNTGSSRTILALGGLALTLGLAHASLAAPPPHAPAHGYRAKKGMPPAPPSKHTRPVVHDLDQDGIPNERDRDIDGDGIPNNRDRQPYHANRNQKPLPKNAKTGHPIWDKLKRAGHDKDAKRHTRHGDIDKDGISNRKDKDIDGDGIRNKKDKDRDGDHVPNKKDDFDRRKNRK